MKKTLLMLLIVAIGMPAGGALASSLLTEDFSYAPGTLLTATGNWANHSGTTNFIPVASPGLTYPGYAGSGIGEAASMTTTGEDDHTTAAWTANSGSVYMAFMVNFSAAQAAGDYFAHFYQSSTLFYGRVFAKLVAGSVNFGVTRGSGTANYSSTPFALNTTHLVVVKYTFVAGTLNDTADLWVDPSLGGSEPLPLVSATDVGSTDGTSFIAVALRQGSASNAPTQYVDGVRVGTEWADVAGGGVPPTGACCFADGTCSVLTASDCAAQGGSYQGDGSLCAPNPCPQLGTCCVSGACTFVLQAGCAGVWTEGGSCTPNPCVVPTGSCCLTDGSCSVTEEAACTGTWTQDGVCTPNPCEQPTGSCCFPDGQCAEGLQTECSGTWTMFGVCAPNPCPQPTGACCFADGTCLALSSADCFTQGGTFQGTGTSCTPNPCPQPVTPLCQVGEDDINGVAIMLGQVVTVEGVALCDGLTWSPTTREFQITDGNCCTDIFSGGLVPAVALGDRVRVTGTVGQFNGKTQLTSPTVTILSSGNPIPPPGSVNTAGLAANGESYESCLITIHCAAITGGTWPASGANGTLTIDDGSGPATLFIDKDTNIDGTPAPTGPFTIIGIADQFDSSSPFTSGYQIKPRNLADIVYECVGACCFADGSCSILGSAACAAQGGSYLGDGTLCSPNPCPQPLGACCALQLTCEVTTQGDCNGTWTLGGDCDPDPCVQPQGACCFPDGTCQVNFEPNCLAAGGIYSGDGTTCTPNPCPQPTGSCCYADGTCAVTLLVDCTGTWTALGTCTPNPCPQPTGACCLSNGLCVVGTAVDCAAVGGAFQGAGTTCTPNPCEAPLVTLCQVAEDDINGVAVLAGQRVTVEGIALCDGMTWSTTIREFQITDGDCCIDIFGGDLTPTVALGDRVRVTGTVQNFNGKTEISTPDMTVTVLSNGNPLPPPGVTTTGTLAAAGEPFESCLFTIRCVTIVGGDPWPASGINANITIDDGSGPVVMRIDKDTDIDGTPAPTGPFTVIGVGDQFDTSSPYTTGWQIKPRMLADLVYGGCTTGACCFPDGSCQVSTGDACASQGGVYSGDGTVCVPNDCPAPQGACCLLTGVCEFLTQAECTGQWLGFGSVCTPNPCDQPTGACCFPDGTCLVTYQSACPYVWIVFEDCEPNPCSPPEGACCFPDGSCTLTQEAACQGIWQGPGTNCSPNLCDQPPATGACCFIDGTCQVLSEVACNAAQGVYQGNDIPCTPNLCPPPVPTERTSWGQIKNIFR